MVRGLKKQTGLSLLEVAVATLILTGSMLGMRIALMASTDQSLKALNTVKVMVAMDAYAQRRMLAPRDAVSDKNTASPPLKPTRNVMNDAWYKLSHTGTFLKYSDDAEAAAQYELRQSGIFADYVPELTPTRTTVSDDINTMQTTKFYLRPDKGISSYSLKDQTDWLNQWMIPITNNTSNAN